MDRAHKVSHRAVQLQTKPSDTRYVAVLHDKWDRITAENTDYT